MDTHSDGHFICLGYEKGMFEIFRLTKGLNDFYSMESIKIFDLSRKYGINHVSFSKSGRHLVISCFKDIVVFNSSTEEFDQEGLLKGNKSEVIALEFDEKSEFVLSNADDGQVLAWEMKPGFKQVPPGDLKNKKFFNQSHLLSWDVQAAWQTEIVNSLFINQIKLSSD